MIAEPVAYSAIMIWMRPQLPYYDTVKKALQAFIEAGLMSEWEAYNSSRKMVLPTDAVDDEEPSDLFRRLLVILGVRFLLAIGVFIVEITVQYITKTTLLGILRP